MNAGISAIALATPRLSLPLEALAELRGVDPNKYRIGLGCHEMALCAPDEDAATLGADAARRALESWGGDLDRIGMIVVGTETALDMSRPLSAWIANELGLHGALRSYEVKHACYGGTLALRQATEWVASGAARGKAALVVATDVSLYAPGDPGEPTQGAGAVAMVVDADARIARMETDSYAYSKPVFDFWRPVGEDFPRVDGAFSLACYKEAAVACFGAWQRAESKQALRSLDALAFHVPFAKMVKKGFFAVSDALEISDAETTFAERVTPHLAWNQRTGNTYTASAWWAFAHALCHAEAGDRVGVFSYGSGMGAELVLFRVNAPLGAGFARDVDARLDAREPLGAEGYVRLRDGERAQEAAE